MVDAILFWFLFGIVPLFLHEFGHWIMLKKYKIPYNFFIDWKKGIIGFRTNTNDIRQLKCGLMGAFFPLLIMIPLTLTFNLFLISLGLLVCLFYTLWTCVEVWYNIKDVT